MMFRRRSKKRSRQTAKWVGTILSVFVLAAWIITTPMFSKYCLGVSIGGPDALCYIGGGAIFFMRGPSIGLEPPKNYQFYWYEANDELPAPIEFGIRIPERVEEPHCDSIALPLWLFFLLFAIPTAYLFFLNRRFRFPPDRCPRCAYNLTGNISGRRPECGDMIRVAYPTSEQSHGMGR